MRKVPKVSEPTLEKQNRLHEHWLEVSGVMFRTFISQEDQSRRGARLRGPEQKMSTVKRTRAEEEHSEEDQSRRGTQ
jgi:hypothetical protein